MAKILYVDDESDWRDLVVTALAGHRVEAVAAYGEAIQALESSGEFDLVLVDYWLTTTRGDSWGPNLLDYLAANHPNVRKIVITGSPPNGAMVAGLIERFGLEEILLKGHADAPDLRRAVERALSRQDAIGDPQLELRQSELRQRLSEVRLAVSAALRGEISRADSFLRAAQNVHGNARADAERTRDVALERLREFGDKCTVISGEIDRLKSVNDSPRLVESITSLRMSYDITKN